MSGDSASLVAEVLDDVATQALALAGVKQPPVDVFAVAQAMGWQVGLDPRLEGRARCVRLRSSTGPRTSIWLRPDPRVERLQWALAHEVGEQLAQQVFVALDWEPAAVAPGMREQVANRLAARLLLPSRWFSLVGRQTRWDLLALKSRFPTASHELIAARMLDTGDQVVITVCDQGRVTWRRGNRPPRPPGLSPLERACWRTSQETSAIVRRKVGPIELVVWPLHEADWRREILRTTFDDSLAPGDEFQPGFLAEETPWSAACA